MIGRLLAAASLLGAATTSLFFLGASPAAAPAKIPSPVASSEPADPGRTFLDTRQRFDLRGSKLGMPVKSLLNVGHRMNYGEFIWRDDGIPQGPAWIRVDLKSQIISVFRAGHEIGTSVIMYGATEKQTPTGVFPILAKMRDHQSSTYDARMPYTLRLTGDGVSIHGSEVRWGAATHGCIGVPVAFARRLFDEVRTGTNVVILGDTTAATARS